MEIQTQYIIKMHTIAFIPYFNECGKLMTIVVEMDDVVMVDLAPIALMEWNLRYYGSSMRGAKEGTKSVLGNINRPPLTVCEAKGIYWFPSKSARADDCIWFALHNVVDCEVVNGKVCVLLTDNGFIEVDVSCPKMNERINNAYSLKGRREKRAMLLDAMLADVAPYYVTKDSNALNYSFCTDLN